MRCVIKGSDTMLLNACLNAFFNVPLSKDLVTYKKMKDKMKFLGCKTFVIGRHSLCDLCPCLNGGGLPVLNQYPSFNETA